MKSRVTKNEIEKSFENIIAIGYCNFQTMLNSFSVNFYTSGINGWNNDIYVINNNTCIVTGYRTFGNIRPSYELVNKYEKAAEKLKELNWQNKMNYETRVKRTRKLLEKFLQEVTKQ